jgi:hypothetical protein
LDENNKIYDTSPEIIDRNFKTVVQTPLPTLKNFVTICYIILDTDGQKYTTYQSYINFIGFV